MRIIELGRCVNNQDPLGLGRIRVEYLDKLNSTVERSVTEYKEWDDNDPFLFYPFLPVHLSNVPQENQLVKLVFWNLNNNSLNKEYISGPYVNTFDLTGQGIDRQIGATSRGVRVRKEPNVYNPKNGELIDAATKGTLLKSSDVGLNGNYGSDVILTRNGVTLRAGKLDDAQYRKTGRPVAYNRPGRISVKKYEQTVEVSTKQVAIAERQDKPLTTLVEYEVEHIDAVLPTYNATLYCYKINTDIQGLTDTFNFTQNKEVPPAAKTLIYTTTFSGETLQNLGKDISTELRKIDMSETHSELNADFYSLPTHPFYYKPTASFFAALQGEVAPRNAALLYQNISLGSSGAFGLSYSLLEKEVPTLTVNKTIQVESKTTQPTTIASLLADSMYRLAYEANVPNDSDKINFAVLDNYELPQEQLLNEVRPKTFSEVRGEPLLELLNLMVQWMLSHKHNPAEVGISDPALRDALLKELQNASQKIINQKLRIN